MGVNRLAAKGVWPKESRKRSRQETTEDPEVEGQRSDQSSVTPLFKGTKGPKHLFHCVSAHEKRGG